MEPTNFESYVKEIAKGLGDGWNVSNYGDIRNSSKNFHFYVTKCHTDKKKVRFDSAHNGDGKKGGKITRTGWPSKAEYFPSFNVAMSRGSQAAINAIIRIMPEVERLSAIVDIEQEKEELRAKNIAKRVASLITLTDGKLKLKADQPNCFEVRNIPHLDRLELNENSTLLGTGYTSMPDWKAEAILKILISDSPSDMQNAVAHWKELKLDFEKLGEGENRLMDLVEAENKLMQLV